MSDTTARHPDGVFWEDGCWTAYLNDVLVGCGPDRPIIAAAYEHHRSADEYRSGDPSQPNPA